MRKISFAALTAIIVLTLGTISFGQTSFGSYVTEAISQNFYQLLTPTTAPTGEQNTANDQTAVVTETKTPDENITAATFTAGDLAVLQVAASASNTTGSIVELNTTTAAQTPAQTLPISGTGANALRFSGSGTSTGYLATTNDGTLLNFTGGNTTDTAANINTILTRGVGAVDSSGTFSLATTYTGATNTQTRGATSVNNTNFYIGDQGGFYTNGATTPSPTGNYRSVKSFGGTVYVFQASTTAPYVSTISAPTGGTVTALPGLPNGTTAGQDFYLISSGSNGTAYDVLYIVVTTGATAGTIQKYSLVSGTWTANGTYTTTFGGFGLAAAKSGAGASLYVSSGTGATTANSLVKLSDTAGYNAAIAITTASNITLYTAPTGAIIKGVAFAPVAATNTAPAFTSNASATFTQNVAGSFQVTASGNPAPTFSTNGTLPNGVTLSSAGLLSGTPTQSGTFTFTITATNGTAPDATQSFTLTVNAAANPTVNLSISPTTGSETAQTLFTATATASAAQATDQTVNFALTGGTATAADFTTIAGTITIPANSTTGTTTFSVVDDTLVEGTENATFTISNPSAGISLGTTTMASVSITDNDVAATSDLTITQSAPTTVASGGTLVYTVTFNNTPAAAVTTPFAVSFVLPASGFSNPTVTSTTGCSPSGTISGGTVTFTGCTLPASGTQTVTISGTATATGGTITSGTATVDTGNAVTETDETNNTAAGVNTTVNAAPTSVVVNEVYGGGGNSGANYNADYIELYNNGTTTVGIGGYSLQYASATGNFNGVIVLPSATIAPGGFYLIQTIPAGMNGSPLTPNFTSPNNVDLSATNGNVLFAAGTTTVGACPAAGAANVIDRLGYGTGVCFEGAGAAPATSATTSAQRVPNGTDTNNNSADFIARTGTPSAANLGSTAAAAQISGRVTTADGRGIQNARLMISGNGLRQPIYVTTGAFGYYRFNDLPAGETYVVSVTAKRYIFNNAARVVSLTEDLTSADFTANK